MVLWGFLGLGFLGSGFDIGGSIIGIGFGGILYCKYLKEPPNPIPIIKAPTLGLFRAEGFFFWGF